MIKDSDAVPALPFRSVDSVDIARAVQVFVAGATGRLGARIVRQLLLELPQLRVRAGVRNPEKAAEYLRTAVAYGLLPSDAARRVTLVSVDLTKPDTIPTAIGNASKV